MDEWDALPLSAVAQAGYCMRRAALLINERLWQENADTAKGRAEHARAHTQRIERRGDQALLYDYPVFSRSLNLNGKCDCVECVREDGGCRLPALDMPVRLYPVEFKHGRVREEISYMLQLCAQAMCLEEMYATRIPEGALFYITAHRRQTVCFDDGLRDRVRQTVKALEAMRRTFALPPPAFGAKCARCSMRELCGPQIGASAAAYLARLRREAVEETQP